MTATVIVLLAGSVVLPTWGLGRLLLRAQRILRAVEAESAARGTKAASIDHFNKAHEDVTAVPRRERNDALWDTVLVGAGMTCGAIASILSL